MAVMAAMAMVMLTAATMSTQVMGSHTGSNNNATNSNGGGGEIRQQSTIGSRGRVVMTTATETMTEMVTAMTISTTVAAVTEACRETTAATT